MSGAVLDASAVIALLHEERGTDRIAEVIHDARVSAVNLAEVIGHFIRLGAERDAIDTMLDQLPLQIVPADADAARQAGALRALTSMAGLSLGDRFCLALALRLNIPAFTADRAWDKVSERVGVQVVQIR